MGKRSSIKKKKKTTNEEEETMGGDTAGQLALRAALCVGSPGGPRHVCLGCSQDTGVHRRMARLVFGTELGPIRKQYRLLGNCRDHVIFLVVGLRGKLYMFFVD